MSLALWLGLARDLAAVLALAAAMLSLAAFWSSETGTGGGLAASVLVIALAGVAGLALHGLLSGGVGLPAGAIAIAMAAVLLAAAFYLTHVFGVRGLWLALLTAVGFGFAGAMIWAFAGRVEAYAGGIGPILAFALLCLLAFGALGALAGRQARLAAASPAQEHNEPRVAMLAGARRLLATPPPWFDCAYATLGGQAVQPAKCPFTPPNVTTNPVWAEGADGPDGALALSAEGLGPAERAAGAEDAAEAAAPSYQEGQPRQKQPAKPSTANPEFDTAAPGAGTTPRRPDAIGEPQNQDAPAARTDLSAPDGEGGPPAGVSERVNGSGSAGSARAAGATESGSASERDGAALAGENGGAGDAAAAPEVSDGADATAAPRIGADAPGQPNAPSGDAPPGALAAGPRSGLIEPGEAQAKSTIDEASEPERPGQADRQARSAYVCFPMTALAADRLCPDQTFGPDDLGVRWLMRGGEAIDAPDSVDCAVDRELDLHVTLFVNLSGDLAAPFPALAQDAGLKLRKAEAVYDAATRVIGGLRGDVETGGRTLMSLYVAGASSLQSPWAEQSFSPDRVDRLFDVSSSGQALGLMRRLKSDTQAVRKNTAARDLAAELEAMLEARPDMGEGRRRSLAILATDALAAELLPEEAAARVGAQFAAKGVPIIAIETGPGAPSKALTLLAERSGGAAFSAGDAETLYRRMSEALDQGRRFCAVRVTAPDRFFREGELQLRLRRRMTDGCALEQIATISCDALRFEERIKP